MGSLPYRGESWTAGVCLPTADAKLLLRHLFLLLARLTAGESAGWSEDDGRRVATSGGGPAKFLDKVLVQDEGPAPPVCLQQLPPLAAFDEQQQVSLWCACFES